MYLSILKIWNFRKYGTGENNAPGIEIHFQEGVNVLIGENDSGKSTIIDAIRYVLHTKSGETIFIDEKDFYRDGTKNRTNTLKIECEFDDISEIEAAPFLEWVGFMKDDEQIRFVLRITLTAIRTEEGRIYHQIRAGMGDNGAIMDGKARDLLRVVYLKPLRDALQDMTHGYKSRIAQILHAHSIFGKANRDSDGRHKLENLYLELKNAIDQFFDSEKDGDGQLITRQINDVFLKKFLLSGENRKAHIALTANELSDILRQLDLILEDNKSGLGSLNLLCVSAELLLFLENNRALKLTLIEELEAHLHPQYQLRLLDYIQNESKFGQFILTTHSITLGSNLPLEKLILLSGNSAFPMGPNYTKCDEEDYRFLHRFLDATKANLFFARGVMMVEGDSECLLIPAIANVLGLSLHEYGVSLVNVGSKAYKRYVKIFQRSDGKKMNIPVSILTDLDVPCFEYYEDEKKEKKVLHCTDQVKKELSNICLTVDFSNLPEMIESKSDLKDYLTVNKRTGNKSLKNTDRMTVLEYYEKHLSTITQADIDLMRGKKRCSLLASLDDDEIKIFIPKYWTLEYELAMSRLFKELEMAVNLAKAEQKGKTITIETIKNDVERDHREESNERIAYEIFKPINEGSVSKPIVAQHLAQIIESDKKHYKEVIENDDCLKYIVDAIKHVTIPLR